MSTSLRPPEVTKKKETAVKVRPMKYQFPEDVKIPNLDHLIGSSVSWENGYFDWETEEEVSVFYSGQIVGFNHDRVLIRLDSDSQVWSFAGSSLFHSEPPHIQKAISYRDEQISHKKHLEAKQQKPHEVYRLIDPRDGSTRYVGMSNNAQARYEQHIQSHSKNETKEAWIQELKDNGLLPLLEVLEKVKGRITAFQQEQYWIGYYLSQGAQLTNKLRGIEQ